MRGKIIHYYGVSDREGRNQDLFDVGQEPWPVHRAVQDHGGGHAREPQAANECCRLPMTMRKRSSQAHATRRAPIKATHFCAGARLIHKNQGCGVQIILSVKPELPSLQDVRSPLLRRMRRFF